MKNRKSMARHKSKSPVKKSQTEISDTKNKTDLSRTASPNRLKKYDTVQKHLPTTPIHNMPSTSDKESYAQRKSPRKNAGVHNKQFFDDYVEIKPAGQNTKRSFVQKQSEDTTVSVVNDIKRKRTYSLKKEYDDKGNVELHEVIPKRKRIQSVDCSQTETNNKKNETSDESNVEIKDIEQLNNQSENQNINNSEKLLGSQKLENVNSTRLSPRKKLQTDKKETNKASGSFQNKDSFAKSKSIENKTEKTAFVPGSKDTVSKDLNRKSASNIDQKKDENSVETAISKCQIPIKTYMKRNVTHLNNARENENTNSQTVEANRTINETKNLENSKNNRSDIPVTVNQNSINLNSVNSLTAQKITNVDISLNNNEKVNKNKLHPDRSSEDNCNTTGQIINVKDVTLEKSINVDDKNNGIQPSKENGMDDSVSSSLEISDEHANSELKDKAALEICTEDKNMVKRKRGRPRTKLRTAEESADSTDKITKETKDNNNSELEKKSSESNNENTESGKKRRGRPRTKPRNEENSVCSKDSTNTTTSELKNKINNELIEVSSESNSKNTGSEKKRRGRPRTKPRNEEEAKCSANSTNKITEEVKDSPGLKDTSFGNYNKNTEREIRKRDRSKTKLRNEEPNYVVDSTYKINELKDKLNTEVSRESETKSTESGIKESKNELQNENKKGRGRPRQGLEDGNGDGQQCFSCQKNISGSKWKRHNLSSHNNLSWRVGVDPPIDLDDEREVKNILYTTIKKTKFLICDKCQCKRHSVVGLLSHMKQCQKSEEELKDMMYLCELCGKLFLPVSVYAHISLYHSGKQEEVLIEKKKSEPVQGGKRAAATKALNLIQDIASNQEAGKADGDPEFADQDESMYTSPKKPKKKFVPGIIIQLWSKMIKKDGIAKCRYDACNFKSKDISELKMHHLECEHAPKVGFSCKHCEYSADTEADIIGHVNEKHTQVSESDSEDEVRQSIKSNESGHQKEVVNRGGKTLPQLLATAKYVKDYYMYPRGPNYYLPAMKLMEDFVKERYSDLLFESLRPEIQDWVPVTEKKNVFLPDTNISLNVAKMIVKNKVVNVKESKHVWKRYKLFESDFADQEATVFCGGPVWSMAWAPVKEGVQYLAINSMLNMDKVHKTSEAYVKPGLIQIWNFGHLDNKKCKITESPKMCFGIAHNYGIIWKMEWCPSGCFQPGERLGLLAIACSDGYVYIISVPFPEQLSDEENIYQCKPVFKLKLCNRLDRNFGNTTYQATRLSWSRSSGHWKIAAGFTNGVVGVWHLGTQMALLRKEEGKTVHLLPYLSFLAHRNIISALLFFPQNDRWLYTGSFDTSSKFWDLSNTSVPISVHKRGCITSACWLAHWHAVLEGYDDGLINTNPTSSVIPCRNFGYKPYSLFSTNSVIWSVAASDWLNGYLQTNGAGEVQMTFAGQMIVSNDKWVKDRRFLIGYTDFVNVAENAKINVQNIKTEKIDDDRQEIETIKSEITEDFQEVEVPTNEDPTQFNDTFSRPDTPSESFVPKQSIVKYPSDYESTQKEYGLVFCDVDLSDGKNMPKDVHSTRQSSDVPKLKSVPLDLWPMTSINRVSWNPNRSSCLFFATGYHSGFVRVRAVNYLKNV